MQGQGPRKARPAISDLDYRPVLSVAEYARCQALQREIWGQAHQLPDSVFVMLRKIGGIVLGAFDRDELVGFSLSFPGVFEGEPVQWSDMLAVRPAWRDRNVGYTLKQRQRDEALRGGYRCILWSYDPLESRNAFFNFCKLGVTVSHYEDDMYGTVEEGRFAGIPTDRFIARWTLAEAPPAAPALPPDAVLEAASDGSCGEPRLGLRAPVLKLEIPSSVQRLKERDMAQALRWRLAVRAACRHYLGHGYVVCGFARQDGRSFYLLAVRQEIAG